MTIFGRLTAILVLIRKNLFESKKLLFINKLFYQPLNEIECFSKNMARYMQYLQ
jgi:hypothetical protein